MLLTALRRSMLYTFGSMANFKIYCLSLGGGKPKKLMTHPALYRRLSNQMLSRTTMAKSVVSHFPIIYTELLSTIVVPT